MAHRYFRPPSDFVFDHMDILRDVDQAIGVANSVARQCEREARAMERSYHRMGDQIMRDLRHNLQSIWSDIAHHLDADDFEDFIRPCAPPRQNFYPRRNNRRNSNAFRRDNQRSPRRHNSGSQEPRVSSCSENIASTSPMSTQQSETNGNNEVCAVCQEQLLRTQEDLILPCIHKFHARCLRPWLRQNRTCPVCRNPVSYEDY